jgi:hypothetical protein
MNVRSMLGRLNDRFFRAAPLREARAQMLSLGEDRERALRQARLLVEVARRTADPVEPLPSGSRSGVVLSLYRDAVRWALVAGRAAPGEPPAELAALWAEVSADRTSSLAPDPEVVDAFGRAGSLDATPEDVAKVQAVADAMVRELEAPRQRVGQLLGQRWSRIAVVCGAVLALGYGARALVLGPDLLAGKPFRTSSSWAGCAGDPPCTRLLFHTDPEANPWVEFDLGSPKRLHRLEVTNRTDCCSERALPLVAEVSKDRVSWTEIGRREAEFSSWTLKFRPRTARYLRLKVPRETAFHLKSVAAR